MASLFDNPITNWAEEEAGAFLKHIAGDDFSNAAKQLYIETTKWLKGDAWNFFENTVDTLIEGVNGAVVVFTPVAIRLAAATINQITGLHIDDTTINTIAHEPPSRHQFTSVGTQFRPVVENMFPADFSAAGYLNRADRKWSLDNIDAYFGTNLLFQLRSLTIATVASFVPEFQLRHLEGLHQTINWAFGFGWLSWSVMSAVMNVTTTKPLEEYYNSLIKPTDFSTAQAHNAFIAGLIDQSTYSLILDHQGLRDDIRAPVLDLVEKDLTDSHLWELYRNANFTRDDIVKAYRLKGYRETRAGQATDILVHKREQDLRDEWVTQLRALYRDCVIPQSELTAALMSEHYTQAESDLVVKVEDTKRRQRTFLSTTTMGKAISDGSLDVNDAYTQLLCRGYTEEDAIITLLEMFKPILPPCEDPKLQSKALVAFLQALGKTLNISSALLKPALLKYLQCLDPTFLLLLPHAQLSADPSILHGKGGNVTLTWSTEFATEAHLSPGVGRVPLTGEVTVHVTHTVSYKLDAISPLGKAEAYALIKVNPEPPA